MNDGGATASPSRSTTWKTTADARSLERELGSLLLGEGAPGTKAIGKPQVLAGGALPDHAQSDRRGLGDDLRSPRDLDQIPALRAQRFLEPDLDGAAADLP